LVGDNIVTTCTRSVARLLTLAAALVFAGCGDSPSPGARADATPIADVQATAPVAQETPAAAPALPFAALTATSQADANQAIRDAGLTPPAAITPRSPTTRPARPSPSTLTLDPPRLNLGSIATGKFAIGLVTLINTGDEPIKLNQCKTSCGCTSANCPTGQMLEPGTSTEIEIRVTAGARARQINKTVTFLVEGQTPVTLPVSVEVVAYVSIAPQTIDPDVQADGKLSLKATDDQPFRILSISPALVDDIPEDEAVEHELFLNWDTWRELGQHRRVVVKIDHPEVEELSFLIRARPKVVTGNALRRQREKLLGNGVVDASVSPPQPDKQLAVAVKYGDAKVISEAIDTGLDQASRDGLLSTASRYGQVEIMQILLASGANTATKDRLGRTAVIAAVQSRKTEAVDVLLASGADVNARDLHEGTALLRAAGSFGNAQMVEALIKAGAEINAADKNGQTALMWAARWGDPSRVTLLIAAGANANARDGNGMTAMDYARNRRGEDTQQLIEIIEPHVE